MHQLEIYFLCIEKKVFPENVFLCGVSSSEGKCFRCRAAGALRVFYETCSLHDSFLAFSATYWRGGGNLAATQASSSGKSISFAGKLLPMPPRPPPTSIIHHDFNIFSHCIDEKFLYFRFPAHLCSDRLICDLIRLLLCQFIFVTSSSMAPSKEGSRRRVDKRRDEILIKKMGRKSLFAVSGLFHPGLISIAGGVTRELLIE